MTTIFAGLVTMPPQTRVAATAASTPVFKGAATLAGPAADTISFSAKKPVNQGVVHHLRFSGLPELPGARGASLYFSGATRKFMTYNAEQFFRTRVEKDEAGKVIPSRDMKDPKSTQALANVILSEDPDVIALQEVGDRRMLQDFNAKYLKNKYPKIVSFAEQPGGLRVAMMAKRDIRIVNATSHLKEQCGGANGCGKRDFLEATFETDTGYQFTVFDGHFKSMTAKRDEIKPGQTAEQHTMPVRLKEAQTAAAIIKRHLDKDPNARIIVAGDFNTLHESPFGKPVIATLTLANDKDPNNDLTEVMLKDGQAIPTHNGKGYYPNNKLDYTFVSKAMLKDVRQAYVSGQFTQAPWSEASDHLPMVTLLEEPDDIVKPQAAPRRETYEQSQMRRHGGRRNTRGRRLDRSA